LVDRILIAEDETDIRNLVKMIFQKNGYKIIEASNGVEAEEKILKELPDLVLLDIVMPKRGGFEVCKSVKNNMISKHIPVVMFSVLGRPIDKEMSLDAGADGHFTKPFIPEELIAEAQNYISRSKKDRFSRAAGLTHDQISGKISLFEYNSSSPYERLVRDYLIQAKDRKESIVVITRESSAIYKRIKDENIRIKPFQLPIVLSQIIEQEPTSQLCLVFDNLTDLILSSGFQTAYNFTRDSVTRLSGLGASSLFLLNSDSHEKQEVDRIRNLFTNQFEYDKELLVKKLE